jgi:hypothetical protein
MFQRIKVLGDVLPGSWYLRVTIMQMMARMVETRPKIKARVSLVDTAAGTLICV